ncbi:MAG TPA: EAL domain-containing protein [Brevundimonas sp.]|nr:EAL domain-containing protein [Brevundimonas sp.]
MSTRSRLLGMAFAGSDLLFELNQERVTYAVGAGPVTGHEPATEWPGRSIADILQPVCRDRLKTLLAKLAPGRRSEPLDVVVLTGDGHGRKATLRAFCLPDLAPIVSCALSWTAPAFVVEPPRQPLLDASGLLRRLGELLTQGSTGPELSIDIVEVPGLGVGDERHRLVGERIEARLQSASIGGSSAARLAPDRFALMRDSSDLTSLADEVRATAAAEGLELFAVTSRGLVGDADAAVAVRTLRLALDDCLREGAAAGEHFGDRLKRTLKDAETFRSIVRDRRFALVWQPIVALDTGAVHHFEALTRFDAQSSAPVGKIAMAEELGLIQGFDLAVAEKALVQLRAPGFGLTRAAVNVSAASLSDDGYVEGLLRMTATEPGLRKRLMIELTETAVVASLDRAERRLAALRDAGIRICLDDYGVCAASLTYLRRLPIDVVKLDGGFVHDLESHSKSRSLVKHLVELCRELQVSTVAEMIEEEAQATMVRQAGVQFGQGWLFGRPSATPVAPAPAVARRKGAVVGWG